MLLGFKRRFEPYILDGSKTHTIRGKRKIPPKAGEICHCYVDPRRSTMRLLGRWPCVAVQDIRIEGDGTYSGTKVAIEGCVLDEDERNLLAWRDGFHPEDSSASRPGPAFDLMLEFWARRLPFHGDVIHWAHSIPSSSP